MSSRDLFMMQILGGGGGGLLQSTNWIHVVFLVFLLAVPILKPERIRVPASFRAAWICFALSIVAPGLVSALVTGMLMPSLTPGGGPPDLPLISIFNALGPALFGISLFFAMKAVVPGFIPPWDSESAGSGSSTGGSSSSHGDGDV